MSQFVRFDAQKRVLAIALLIGCFSQFCFKTQAYTLYDCSEWYNDAIDVANSKYDTAALQAQLEHEQLLSPQIDALISSIDDAVTSRDAAIYLAAGGFAAANAACIYQLSLEMAAAALLPPPLDVAAEAAAAGNLLACYLLAEAAYTLALTWAWADFELAEANAYGSYFAAESSLLDVLFAKIDDAESERWDDYADAQHNREYCEGTAEDN